MIYKQLPSTCQLLPTQSPSSSNPPNELPSFSDFLSTWCHMVWKSSWPVWVSCPVSAPSQLCVPPPCGPLAGRAVGEPEKTETALALCSTAWQQVKHHCVISIVLLLKPKHGTTPGTRKENNTVQAETNTISTPYSIQFTSCSGLTAFYTS